VLSRLLDAACEADLTLAQIRTMDDWLVERRTEGKGVEP
jgi:hypothetical protein